MHDFLARLLVDGDTAAACFPSLFSHTSAPTSLFWKPSPTMVPFSTPLLCPGGVVAPHQGVGHDHSELWLLDEPVLANTRDIFFHWAGTHIVWWAPRQRLRSLHLAIFRPNQV